MWGQALMGVEWARRPQKTADKKLVKHRKAEGSSGLHSAFCSSRASATLLCQLSAQSGDRKFANSTKETHSRDTRDLQGSLRQEPG